VNLGLEGKRALVLAGSSGLGRATALELAREGAIVALCSRDAGRAESAAAAIREETGGRATGYVGDVTDAGSLEQLIARVGTDLGGLDVLVCNAGGPPPGGFAALDETKWDTAYQLTLQSVVRSVRLALPHFGDDGGAILTIGSSSVERPIPNLLLSNVFRPAVWGLCNHLATELAPRGIRVNMLSPGRILTGRTEQLDRAKAERTGQTLEEVQAASLATIPMGRFGDPAEFGRMAAFLCSDAASYVTGSSLLADGGSVQNL
jgi:3-oxoacyl-[acyl-carrier protein] reductase